MNTLLQTVKRLKRSISFIVLTALCLFLNKAAIAQTINISINIIPPYSPYYSDYSGINASKVLLILENFSNAQQKIKLVGRLDGDNGVHITTYTNYVPLQPIILNAHQILRLNGAALKDIFDLNNLSVIGVDKGKLAQTSRIPAGNYNLCIQAVDYNSRAPLSPNAPSGCTSLIVSYPEPPILINPLPSATINATMPQTIIFNWTNPGTVPMGTQYTIQLAQMPDVQADPNQVLNATSFPMLSQTVMGTSYVYSLSNLGLTPGKKYAWRVIAVDPTGRTVFKNNGVSAASMFTYAQQQMAYNKPSAPYKVAPPAMSVTTAQVSGVLAYKYHDLQGMMKLPKGFTGLQEDATPLANEPIQLCYGLCRVATDLKPHLVSHMVSLKDIAGVPIPPSVQIVYVGADSARLNYMKTDTITPQGLPANASTVQASGYALGGIGQIIANTTTGAGGSFSFNFTPPANRVGRIVELYPDNTALVYCYYINIKNKHYTDPINYVYIPAGADQSSINLHDVSAYADNYFLTLKIDRSREFNTDQAQAQGVTVENNANTPAIVYILRKTRYHTISAPNVPANEGDNSGRTRFASQADTNLGVFKNTTYEIIAKDTAKANESTHVATASFSNLIYNLDPSESYYIYAEYKGTSVYFAPQEFSYQPDNIPEYNPQYYNDEGSTTAQITPSFVSVRVKGVLKYKFNDGKPIPLANTAITLQTIASQSVLVNGSLTKQFQFGNPNNKIFATATTDASGYFELDAGLMDYDKYNVSNGNSTWNFKGLSQYLVVNNPYYGSPDQSYSFEAGNTYNVGEVIARVKEYSTTFTVKGENLQTGSNTGVLPGQRVYLCRQANINAQNWGVPVDEGSQNNLPLKQINDVSKTLYNVLSYGITDQYGNVTFNRMVAGDLYNADDRYYIYSESGVTSSSNYSTQYGLPQYISATDIINWQDYYGMSKVFFNSAFDQHPHTDQSTITSIALAPYIEGAVYPFGNESTNALPGVKVDLYNVNGNKYSSKQFGIDADALGPDEAVMFAQLAGSKLSLSQTQTTGIDGLFHFDNLSPTYWSLLVYSRAGFITGYTPINSGAPLLAGQKQTVKGFLLPPQNVHVTVRDFDTGIPLSATVVVGDQFSWAYQTVTVQTSPSLAIKTNGLDLKTPYGKVLFTVIPDDNVHYHTQKISYTIQKSDQSQTIPDLKLESNRNRINVCVDNAVTHQSISGYAVVEDIPASANPGGYTIAKDNCHIFSFISNVPYYRIKVTADGYATLTKTIANNSTQGYASGVEFDMSPALTLKGTVTVNSKPVANAKVYIKELPDQPAAYSDANGNYVMTGLPMNNQQVTLTAVDAGMNAIGQQKLITLNMKVDLNLADFLDNSGTNTNSTNNNGMKMQKNTLAPQNNTVTAVQTTQPELSVATNTKNINFSLTADENLNLSNLYGYPLEVENLERQGDVAYLTGRISIPANNVFGMNASNPYLHFTNIKIDYKVDDNRSRTGNTHYLKESIKPINDRVVVDDDNVDINVYGKYGAQLRGYTAGIQVVSGGLIGGTVALNGENIAGNVALAGELTLMPQNNKPKMGRPNPQAVAYDHYHAVQSGMNVFTSNLSNAGSVIAPYYSFSSTNQNGVNTNLVHYSLNNLYYSHANGYLTSDGLHLFTVIHTNLQNIAKPDIAQYIGEVVVNDASMNMLTSTDSTQLSIPIDDWSIKSTSWRILGGPLTMNGNVFAGTITVPFTGMQVDESTIDFGTMQLNQIGIAGVKNLVFNPDSTTASFGFDKAADYGTQYNKQYGCWSLSLLPVNPNSILTSVAGLPDLAADNTVNIMNISLYSKGGESLIELQQNHPVLTLNGFASFQPYEIESGKDYLKVNGALNFTIPGLTGTENTAYSLNYVASGGVLVHKHAPIAGLNLTTNGIRAAFDTTAQVFTNNVLKLTGTLQDKATNSPYAFHVNLTKDADSTHLNVIAAAKDKILMGEGQQMSNIKGFMHLTSPSQWNYFTFDGDVTALGMAASDSTHMGFVVQGDLVANRTHIGMQNMSLPGGIKNFNLTYDFKQKAIVGSLHIDSLTTPIAKASADLEMQFGGGVWYILGAATITDLSVPLPLNGASAAFLVGNTPITDQMLQIIQPVFHNGVLPKDLPKNFPSVKGSFFAVGVDMKLPIVPDIDLNLAIADLHIHYGVYANAYLGLSFADGIHNASVIGGVKVGAYVNVSAGASLGLVCAGISLAADVDVEANIKMDSLNFTDLNPISFYKNSYVNLDLGAAATFTGEAYVGAGVCSSSCSSVKLWGFTVPPGCFKKSISGSMSLNLDFNITKYVNSYTPDKITASANLFGTPYSVTYKP